MLVCMARQMAKPTGESSINHSLRRPYHYLSINELPQSSWVGNTVQKMLILRLISIRITLVMLALLAPAAANAGERAVGAGTAEAVIVDRLSLAKIIDMDLGKIVAGSTAGTLTLDPATGVRTKTGGVILAGGNGTPAAFVGMGRYNQLVTLSLGSNSIVLRHAGGPQTMLLDNFVISSAPPAPLSTIPRTFRINDRTGMFRFNVGGRLNVGARQEPGIYSGTFSVTIQYL